MKKQNIVVLTGAGVSAESGIKTFRAADGLWEDHRVEDVATPEAFDRNRALVQRFYNQRRSQLLDGIEPNLAHHALADYERRHQGQFTLVTQNIDNLHEQAGSNNLLHMHGEILKARCQNTQEVFDCREDINDASYCTCCHSSNTLRPHIVWFGEMPLYMTQIESALTRCDLFVSIGTSGSVYPAAGFFQLAKHAGAHTVELNLEPSANSDHFDETHYGLGSDVVPAFFEQLS
ncbi:MAG: Sir2 family NAD+-dependent deacetylase [Cellvibrionaceae bacterium]